jgi:branched-chain amino acid transport system substrate-binding protein
MMKKGIIGITLVLSLGLCLAGVVTAEEGVTDSEIVIGSHLDLSGAIAMWGKQTKLGMDMKVREINEAGGIHGRKIRLVVEDNAYDPKKAIMVTNKMINLDKVFCFIGNMGTATALASFPIIINKKIPHLFPMSTAKPFYDPYNRYSFNGFPTYYDQSRNSVKYFVEQKKYTKFGMLYQDDEMGIVMKQGVEDQLATTNLKLLAAESYKRGATEFSTQIAKLNKAEPQVIMLATIVRETVGAMREAKKIGWNVEFCGQGTAYSKVIPDLAQKSGISADGLYVGAYAAYPYEDSPLPTVREWFKRHKEWFGVGPDMPAVTGYQAVLYFSMAAEKAGRDLTREKLVDALETMNYVKDPVFGGSPLILTPKSHLGVYHIFMTQLKEGKFVKISDIISHSKLP